jgi:hypothetical protein
MNNRIAEIQQQCEKRNTTNPIIFKNNLATVDVVRALMEEIASCNEDVAYLLAQLAERVNEIERLQESQRWIPVNERLPEHEAYILIFSPGNKKETPEIKASRGFMVRLKNTDVTHWMPLPEPPEKGAEHERD